MTKEIIDLNLFQAAAKRIKGYVRRTPLVPAAPVIDFPNLYFKPECLQVSGSFKARGAFNSALSLSKDEAARGLITASGGNFGAAVAFAGQVIGNPAHVIAMEQSTETVRQRIRNFGAKLEISGYHWDQSWEVAEKIAQDTGATLLHPFATPEVIGGQGTIGLEILEDMPDVDTVLVAIGGGGMIGGTATAIKLTRPDVRVIGVETVGCPTLTNALKAGHPVVLDDVQTNVPILGARKTEMLNYSLVEKYVDEIILVDEDRPKQAAKWMWEKTGLAVELGAATVVAAVLDGLAEIRRDEKTVVVLCGAGTDGIS